MNLSKDSEDCEVGLLSLKSVRQITDNNHRSLGKILITSVWSTVWFVVVNTAVCYHQLSLLQQLGMQTSLKITLFFNNLKICSLTSAYLLGDHWYIIHQIYDLTLPVLPKSSSSSLAKTSIYLATTALNSFCCFLLTPMSSLSKMDSALVLTKLG